MPKEFEKKFEELMKKEGIEKLAKSDKERFEELMKKQGMEKLMESPQEQLEEEKQEIDPSKPIVYVAKFPARKGERPMELEIFKTKEDRDKWYETMGREIENAYRERIVFGERPKREEDEEFKAEKWGL